MAVRNLARTVVEGGRGGWSQSDRREIARRGRRNWRFDGDGEPYQRKATNRGMWKEFADRLKPMYRWLESRVGRNWDDVYSEFLRENNARSLKGWHLWTHLRDAVCCAGFARGFRFGRTDHDTFCAEGGVLHRGRLYRRWHHDHNAYPSAALRSQAHEWAAGRRVIDRGVVLFWTAGTFVPSLLDPKKFVPATPGAGAQGRRLSATERAYFVRIGVTLRKELTHA